MAGDSSGASLCLAAVQVVMNMQRRQKNNHCLRFNGKNVPLVLPAGVTCLSAGIDATMSLPSNRGEKGIDFMIGDPHYRQDDFPPDSIWPSNPPRGEIHCDVSAMCHPLISPLTALDWTGGPPLWLSCGNETLEDANKLLAQRAARQGVPVQFELYESMPHVFAWVLGQLPQADVCIQNWASACHEFATTARENVCSFARLFRIGDVRKEDLQVEKLISLTIEQALVMMRAKRRRLSTWVYEGKGKASASL